MSRAFWKKKTLEGMTREEWESLCDRCGICCLQKIEDEETGEIHLSGIACEFLDVRRCRCKVYRKRAVVNPACVTLTPQGLQELHWLPETCAYRRMAEGKGLEPWHPLVSGDPESVHEADISVRGKVVSGKYVHPEDIC